MDTTTSAETSPSRPTPGAWLAANIDRLGISVRQLADALGVTTQTIYDWRGDRGTISEERVPQLAQVLKMSELEARRGLGFWVPSDDGEKTPAVNRQELEQIRTDLLDVLERLDRLQQLGE